MRCGIDLQNIHEFNSQVNKFPRDQFLANIFDQEEISGLDLSSIIAKFCIKECFIKAGVIAVGEWKRLKVLGDEDFKVIKDSAEPIKANINVTVAGDYVLAAVILV
jgi:phosphopantetheinyl transferase (holo-ACP synthase)